MTGAEDVLSSTDDPQSVATPTEDEEPKEVKLLFFGTFYHDSSTEYNVDLVQLKETTRVTELRVIPLGATVTLPNGSIQLGATNPSDFELEVYYNDLQCPTKSTFELLSFFSFNDKSRIQLLCDPNLQIITDGILVRGLYSTVTLAMYGYNEKVTIKEPPKEEISPEAENKVDDTSTDTEAKLDSFEFERRLDDSKSSLDEREAIAEVRVSSFIPVNIEDIPQAIPTITTRVGFDPISRNLSPEQEEPFDEDMDQPEDEVEVSSNDPFDVTSASPLIGSSNYNNANPITEIPNDNSIPPFGGDAELMEVEDISDGEVPSSLEDDDSCHLSPKLPPCPIIDEKSIVSSTPLIVSEPIKETSTKITTGPDLSPSHEQLSDQDGSLDGFEPGFEEIISDEEMPDYSESDYFPWGEFTSPLLNKPFNHMSESFQVTPLLSRNTQDALIVWKKSPEESLEHLIGTIEKYSKDIFENSVIENWVEALENVIPYIPAALTIYDKKKQIEREQLDQTLWFWVEQGLNYELAKEHSSLPHKVRHIKAGVRLVQCLANCGGDITSSLLRINFSDFPTSTVQHVLLDLLMEQHMNIFTKLLILRTLDATLTNKEGYLQFMCTDHGKSCYQRLVEFTASGLTPTRISFAFRSVATKINALVGLDLLENCLGSLSAGVTDKELMSQSIHIYEDLRFLAINVNQFLSHPARILPAAVMVELPQLNSPGHNPNVSFIRILEEGKFMKISAAILNNKEINMQFVQPIRELLECLMDWEVGLIYLCNEGEATTDVLKILFQIEDDGNDATGTYLAHCLEVMMCVDKLTSDQKHVSEGEYWDELKALQTLHSFLGSPVGRKALVHVIPKGNNVVPLLKLLHSKSLDDPNKSEQLELERITKIGFVVPLLVYIIRMCDSLPFYEKHGERIHELVTTISESTDGLGKLKEVLPFLTTTLTPAVLTYDGIDQLCETIRNKKDDLFVGPKITSENYGFPPELTTIMRVLLALGVRKDDEDITKCLMLDSSETVCKELKHKLALVKMHSLDCVSMFSNILNRITEEFAQPAVHSYLLVGATGDALVGLVSPLIKILRRIVAEVIKVRKAEFKDTCLINPLLHTHALMNAFPRSSTSYDGAQEVAANIVQTLLSYTIPTLKVGEETEEELNKSSWTAVIDEVIKFTLTAPYTFVPGLQILSELLPLPLPISTKVPLSEENSAMTVKLRRLWSAYLHGVSSNIQNLIGTMLESTNQELVKILKRVCVQLADLSASTCLVVCRAILDPIWTSFEADVELATEVPNQLALNSSSVNAWVEKSQGRSAVQCSAQTERRLGFLVSLINRCGVIKCGVLQAVRGLTKVDEKYSEFISQLSSILIPQHSKPTIQHLQAQDHVIAIFQAFCDIENGLLLPNCDSITNLNEPDVVISNTLPHKELFTTIINTLLEYINTTDELSSTNAPILESCFRVLVIILDTDYGFYLLKIQLEKFPGVLRHALGVITSSKLEQSSVFETLVPCVASLMHLLKFLILPQDERINHLPLRTLTLSVSEMCKCIAWLDVPDTVSISNATTTVNSEIVDGSAKLHDKLEEPTYGNSISEVLKVSTDVPEKVKHPLSMLEQILKKYQDRSANEIRIALLEYIYGSFEAIHTLMNFCNNKCIKPDTDTQIIQSEPLLPQPELLPELFAIRPTYVIVEKSMPESDSFASVWLTSIPPTFDLEGEETESVVCDLSEINRAYFRDYDVIKEVERLARLSELQKLQEPEKRNEFKSRSFDDYNHRRGGMNTGGGLLGLPPRKSTFNSSLRGNNLRGGFSRGLLPGPGRGGSHFDPFRSRPPNTSRPPSLHVDDFVAMESGHGQSGPSYNKGGARSGQDNFSNRARANTRAPMGRPYNDNRSRPYRQPQSGNPYYQHPQQRHDNGTPRGRMGRGRGYNTGGNERWSNEGHRGGAMLNYGRQDHASRNTNYDRSSSSGASGRNSNVAVGGNRQQPYVRHNYREVPPGPRSSGSGGTMQSSQRWKDNRNFTRQ